MTSITSISTVSQPRLGPIEGWASGSWGDQRIMKASPPNAEQGVLPAGSMIDGYRIAEMITATNYSITYRAQSVIDGNSYFIKEFYPKDLVKSRNDKNGSLIWDKDRWWGTKTNAIKRRLQVFATEGEILRR